MITPLKRSKRKRYSQQVLSLGHFIRIPPGLRPPELVPQSNDLGKKLVSQLTEEAESLYAGRGFVFTIPSYSLEAWRQSGQLQSLWDLLVKLDWSKYSLQQWTIKVSDSELSPALVREAYHFSPAALGYSSDFQLSPQQKRSYDKGYIRMLNSVVPFPAYQGNYINPEILLPFPVPLNRMRLERIIE